MMGRMFAALLLMYVRMNCKYYIIMVCLKQSIQEYRYKQLEDNGTV